MAVLGIILGSFDDEADYDPSRHGAAATYGQFAAPRRHMRSRDPQGQAFRIGEAECSHQGGKWAVKSSGNRIDSVMA
jgi:hypothetical protein